jgi:Flp pilus assembly protein CpaB
MRSRGLVVAIALVLAVAAAAAVVLYTQGVKESGGQGELTPVIVSTQEIPANQRLDPLIDQGVFTEIEVPSDALVPGAVQNVEELRGVTTTTPILMNEQISTARLSIADERPNALGITEGHVAVSVEIDAPQGGVGNIQPGDNVSVYATYQSVEVIGANVQQVVRNPGSLAQAPRVQLPSFTLTLIPTVRVLKIQNPPVDVETGRSDSSRIQVTLDLLPEDAQNLVFAQENARIWLGLLPPNEEGVKQPGTFVPVELLLGRRSG